MVNKIMAAIMIMAKMKKIFCKTLRLSIFFTLSFEEGQKRFLGDFDPAKGL